MALESLSTPVRSTPPTPPQTVRLSATEPAEKRDERTPEPAATSSDSDSGGAVASKSGGQVANALRGAILDIVV